MNLYYTGEFDSETVISFRYSQTAIEGTMAALIMRKDFHRSAVDARICANCDFRHYCNSRT